MFDAVGCSMYAVEAKYNDVRKYDVEMLGDNVVCRK